MKMDIFSFVVGSAWPLVLAIFIYLIANRLRHRCKAEGCKCHTVSTYRLLHMHKIKVTKCGFWTYAIFKFRTCRNGHVSPSMKTKTFTADQIRSKSEDEFEWNSEFINNICAKAGIENPGTDYLQNQFSSPNPTPRISPTDKIRAAISSSDKHIVAHHFHHRPH